MSPKSLRHSRQPKAKHAPADPRHSSTMASTTAPSMAPAVAQVAGLGSEDSILARIDRHFPRRHSGVVRGRGDDCAELRLDSPHLAVSSDIFLENIHFRRSYFTPEEIGHKALAVNLSDLAAAGASPLGFMLNLMLPKDLPPDELEDILSGMGKLAQIYDLPLCGGDLSRAQPGQLGLVITIWGAPAGESRPNEIKNSRAVESPCPAFDPRQARQAEAGPFLRRGQAQAGDYIFIIGEMGLARVGLLSLEALHAAGHGTPSDSPRAINNTINGMINGAANGPIDLASLERRLPQALKAHLMPQPQINAGLALARFKKEHPACRLGLMDLSDGLCRDLPRLLGAGIDNGVAPYLDPGVAPDMRNGLGSPIESPVGFHVAPPVERVEHDADKPGRFRKGQMQGSSEAGLRLGAQLQIDPGTLHPELRLWAESRGSAPAELIEHVCQGGEDYALLGTCSPEHWERLVKHMEPAGNNRPATRSGPGALLKKIGVVTAESGLSVNGEPVSANGFDHFSTRAT